MKRIDDLENAQFSISKKAFNPEKLVCDNCNKRMEQSWIAISLDEGISINLSGFGCTRCGKQYLSLEESRKLDKAIMLNKMLKEGFRIERSLSFDGDNYTFRVPKEFTRKVNKRKIEILPLGAKEFCACVK